MARKHTEYRHTCEICGEVFYSPRISARFDSPKCKMVNYRRVKAQRLIQEKLTLDMDTYLIFQHVCERTPAVAEPLIEFLKNHDKDSFKSVLHMLTITQSHVVTPIDSEAWLRW